jgi:hypothetical protein
VISSWLKSNHQPRELTIAEQLHNECGAMIRHASASGQAIPASVLATVSKLDRARSSTSLQSNGGSRSDSSHASMDNVAWRPDERDCTELGFAHRRLTKIVAPATPQSITVLNEERTSNRFWRFFGPIWLIRWLMVAALILLVSFILVFVTVEPKPVVDGDVSWTTRFWTAVYLLCAAGLGATFAGLFKANQELSAGGYDPKEEPAYSGMLVLGLIAGVLLSQVMPENFAGLDELTQPLLALVGGFSAPAVYSILQRLVETVQMLIRGDAGPRVGASGREATAGLAAEVDTRETLARAASKLVQLQREAGDKELPDYLRKELDGVIDDLLLTQLTPGS